MAGSRKGKQAVRNGGWPAWLLVAIGIVAGAIVMAIIYHLGRTPMSRSDQAQPQPAAGASSDQNGIAAQDKQDKQSKYDFYQVLPEKEVAIPDDELKAKADAERSQTSDAGGSATETANADAGEAGTNHSKQGQYLLQVGSFNDKDKADELKAKLALKGFRANIKPVTVNGETWNRVRLGPYTSTSKLEATKNKLTDAGIHAIALKKH